MTLLLYDCVFNYICAYFMWTGKDDQISFGEGGGLKFILMHACMNVDAIVAMIVINKALSVTNVATLNQIQILEQKFVPNH